jgi:hypothetical protein
MQEVFFPTKIATRVKRFGTSGLVLLGEEQEKSNRVVFVPYAEHRGTNQLS